MSWSGKKYNFRHHKLYANLKLSLFILKAQEKEREGVMEVESLEVLQTRTGVEFPSSIGNPIAFRITRFYNK